LNLMRFEGRNPVQECGRFIAADNFEPIG
jgi:hypothetical protein